MRYFFKVGASFFPNFSGRYNEQKVNVTAELAAGATGETTNDYVLVAPTNIQVDAVDFIMTAVNTGTSNEPTVSLRKVTANEEIGATTAIVLGGAVGDVAALTLDPTKVVVAAGEKLLFRIVNPTATITTALKGKLQIDYHEVP